MRKISTNIAENILGNIRYRNNVVTGEIAVDNGNRTYNVYISGSDIAYPNIPTTVPNPAFSVGDGVELLIEYGSKEMPIIIGYSQKVVQNFIEDEVDYSGTARVKTLDAYSITGITAYLEGRIYLSGGARNCTRRGFYYGTTTAYGSDTYSTGSFAAGSYNKQVIGLSGDTTYHFQAYILDADGDEQIGRDKTMITEAIPLDVGSNADAGGEQHYWTYTVINKINPASASGTITKIYIWFNTYNGENVTVATFEKVGVANFTARDSEVLGTVTFGSIQEFDVNLTVMEGDYVGVYFSAGYLRMLSTGVGYWRAAGNETNCSDLTFSSHTNRTMALYGTGN